ncbi:MAG: DUF5684 domain-containing protein [Coriobacteriales bacterium]|jgi:hypothetical protein|nr:DUF5684 domain-containing protein [Coriobacteriales bacterium]
MLVMIAFSTLIQAVLSPFIIAARSSRGSFDSYDDWAIVLGAFLIVIVILIVFYVVCAIFYMKLFAKANVPAWKAWVPVVNSWKFLELGGYPGALCLLSLAGFIPFIGWAGEIVALVFFCLAAYQIGLKLSKDGVWVVLYIFLSIVWLGIVALDRSTWNDSLGKPARGPERPPTWPPYGGGSPTGVNYYSYTSGQGGGYGGGPSAGGSYGSYPSYPTTSGGYGASAVTDPYGEGQYAGYKPPPPPLAPLPPQSS